MKKNETFSVSTWRQVEGLSILLLTVVALVFLYYSARTLYYFPVPDSYRWYGDETQTWMLLGWKNLLAHGRLIVPIALESGLEQSPGMLLGSCWCSAVVYGLPQLLLPVHFDPVSTGRTVTFILAILTLFTIGIAGYRLKVSAFITAFCIILLATTRTFTFASHCARYDMITGFAVVAYVAFFAVLSHDRRWNRVVRGGLFAFMLGFFALMAGLTISPHAGSLLLVPTIFITFYFGAFRTVRNVFALISGAVSAFAILALVYYAANHQLVLAGITSGANQAGAYLDHLPVLRLFSWSAQSHQLSAKLYYLWHEAPAFTIALPLIAVSEVALLIRKTKHTSTLFVTICLICVLAGAAFLQSTLPYYLSHYLPLAALVLAMQLNEWYKTLWLRPLMAVASISVAALIFVVSLPELENAGRIGNKIDEANTAAIQAAFAGANMQRDPNHAKPLVLAQGPAVHELLRDTTLRAMTESFLFFPVRNELPDTTIARAGVGYIVDYNKPMTPEYEAAVKRGTPVFSRAGTLLDRSLDYFHDTTGELDTLTLYKVETAR